MTIALIFREFTVVVRPVQENSRRSRETHGFAARPCLGDFHVARRDFPGLSVTGPTGCHLPKSGQRPTGGTS